MLTLKDVFHLPQLDNCIAQLVAAGPGLIVVAGLDPRPLTMPPDAAGFLPSGRATIFRILVRQMLEAQPAGRATIVTEDKEVVRLPRELRRRVELLLVEPPFTYAGRLAEAARRPDLLVIDRLCPETASAALAAAQSGLRVLSQLDTVFRGADVAAALLDMGAPPERLAGLTGVVAVERLPRLCPKCRQPAPADAHQLADLQRRYPHLASLLQEATFFQAGGCADCHGSGRHGDVAAFDVFCAPATPPHLLPLAEYVLRLATLGHLPLADVMRLEQDQLQRTYRLLAASEGALAEANAALERKVIELNNANRVLQRRTEALISLQGLGQVLITSTDLNDLAQRVCRQASELCGADRAILYYLRSADTAQVLAVSGWEAGRVPKHLDAALIREAAGAGEPLRSRQWPPGIAPRSADVEGAELRAGLRVPLIAQGQPVGLMIVHTTQKSGFAPGEVALLRTFAQQAALAIQRAGLIEQLQEKIAQLEAAQAELVQKERLERELELARQVQQSVLPRIFPLVPGYTFAACNEPARRVGGDLYDVILLAPDRFGVVIADVSGKGMPAALYMALTRSLLLAEARRQASPRAVLANVHRLLLELGQPNMFVTVFYGVVDGPARRLTYARAGHERPLLLRGEAVQPLGGVGTFLGYPDLDDLPLSEEHVDLAAGDRLVLYTDGLTDALAADGRAFGQNRFISLLQSRAFLPPDEFCAAVFRYLAAFQGPAEQYDDMTMLVVEVK
ncbi:MAG: GAF domain-containing protein [Chloroflexi bacterium]|nr:GAF domain-containing protein [Chloroflexota bacterium]